MTNRARNTSPPEQQPLRVWSRQQKAIFEDVRSGTGHVVCLARAGCGKTTTLVEALNYVPKGSSCVMFSFGRAIADELQKRAPKGVLSSTLHRYGNGALYRRFGKIPLDDDKSLRIVADLVRPTNQNFDLRRAVAKVVALAKGALASTTEEIEDLIDAFDVQEAGELREEREGFIDLVQQVLDRSKALDKEGRRLAVPCIDYNDMNWLPIVLNLPIRTFDRVFVDETQDLNACQVELALRACSQNGRILAIGDDKQAIYRFRGADTNAVQRVIERLSARVLTLSETYRCARSIVREANRFVPELTAFSGNAEGSVARLSEGLMMSLVRPGDFILSRTNAPLVGYCRELVLSGRRANIQGRDLSSALEAIVKRSRAKTIPELVEYVEGWEEQESKRLEKRGLSADTVTDKADCLRALAKRSTAVDELMGQLLSLFGDDKNDASRVTLSTTHKAKGLERDRVFVLADTYLRGKRVRGRETEPPNQEEKNLYYVAVTRAKRELYLVRTEES